MRLARFPAPGTGRAVELASGVWTLLMYLSLGAIPALHHRARRLVRFIVDAGDAAPDAPVGGKARALAELLRAGFEVPRWFVVTPDAFWASLSTRDRERFPSASDYELREIVQRVQPVVDVTNRIEAAIRALAPDGRRLAVRSSASDEDGAHHSFAGQLESLLNVAHRDVASAIAAVWHSGFSDRILAYRRQHGLPLPPPVPAVMVQRMVDARVSGVAFSADPVSGRRTVAVVGAIPGLGTALVSGEGDADSWHVSEPSTGTSSHAEEILTRAIGIKTRIHVADHDAKDGVRTATLDDAVAARPALDDREVVQVARLVRQVAQHAGRPQDIEWAFENGDVLLLQARPDHDAPVNRRSRWRAPPVGQQQHRRKLQRRDDAADILVCRLRSTSTSIASSAA